MSDISLLFQGRISSVEDEVAWYLKTVLDQYVPNVNPHIRQVISCYIFTVFEMAPSNIVLSVFLKERYTKLATNYIF